MSNMASQYFFIKGCKDGQIVLLNSYVKIDQSAIGYHLTVAAVLLLFCLRMFFVQKNSDDYDWNKYNLRLFFFYSYFEECTCRANSEHNFDVATVTLVLTYLCLGGMMYTIFVMLPNQTKPSIKSHQMGAVTWILLLHAVLSKAISLVKLSRSISQNDNQC